MSNYTNPFVRIRVLILPSLHLGAHFLILCIILAPFYLGTHFKILG